MKLVKNFVLAVLLASLLAVSAPAGELGTPGYTSATPTPTPEYSMTASTDGTVADSYDPTVGTVTTETSDYLFFEALAALLSVY
jgi:hypothetical protein